jgi:3'-phosphoadenosine 5'-phosphosulfate sulfotransferase (PAPS reductase)/FAD synthetase
MQDSASSTIMDLPERLSAIRNEMKSEYLESHQIPWIVGFSGGKDSTMVLQLVFTGVQISRRPVGSELIAKDLWR